MARPVSPETPASTRRWGRIGQWAFRLVVCIVAVLAVSSVLYKVPLRDRPLSAVLTFLFVVLIVAALWGFRYVIFVSVIAALAFSLLVPPVGRISIRDSRDVFALVAFLIIGITTGRLSDRARREALNLRDTEAILSQAQRIARIGVWVTRPPMIAEYWSPTAFQIFGIDPGEGPPQNLEEFMRYVHPEDRERVLRETDVLEAGRVFECKYRIVRPDGAIRVIREVGSPVQESGAVQRFVGAWMDITEQEEMTQELQRREAALQDSEEQWRATFESNPTMYFMVDKAGTILSVNPFGAEQLGYNVSELVGQSVLNVFYEPDRPVIQAHANDCFQNLGKTMRWEARKIRKDGTMLWVRETANAVVLQKRPVLLVVCEVITEQKRAEEAARRSENQLRDVIDAMPALVWSTLPDGAEDFVNQRWRELTGLPLEAALGWNWEKVVHPDDRRRYVAEWHAALNNGQTMESEIRVRMHDGEYRWFFIRNVPLRDEVGRIVKWYGTGIDVEDRKRAEERLRRREKELRDVIETMPAMVFAIRPDGSTEFVNRRVLEYTGLSAETISGPGWQSTVHPEDLDSHMNKWRASMAGGEPFENEVRHRNAKGEYRWFLIRAVPLRDEHRDILKWYGILTDIEDRKRAEEALHRSEKELRDVIDTIPTMAWTTLPDGANDFANQSWMEYSGTSAEEASGAGWKVSFHPADIATHVEKWQVSLATGRPFENEARIKRARDGEYRWFLHRAVPLRDDNGKILKWYGISTDIEDRKRAEQALHAAMSERMRLAAFRAELGTVLAHEENLKGTLHHCAEAMVRHLDAAFARVWTLSSDGRELQLQASAGMYTRLDGSHSRIPFGQLKIGLIAQEKKPHLTNNVQNDPRVNDKEWARREKMISFAGYPLMVEDRVVGVMGMFSRKPLSESTLEALSFVADAMAQIIDRKRAEEALRRSEAYLAEAQRLSHTGSWAHDLRNDRTIYWSEEMYRIHGFDPKDGLPSRETLWQMFHPEDLKVFRERYANALRNHEKDDIVLDSRLVMPDGSLKYMHGIGHPILNESGDIIEFRGTVADVTERKKAEDALRRSEAYLAEAQRLSKTGSWAWDPHSERMLHCSEELYRMFDIAPSEDMPSVEVFRQRVHPEDLERVKAEGPRLRTIKKEDTIEYKLLLPNGAIKYVLSMQHPVFDGAGELVEVIGTVVDVTARKRAEAELTRLHQLEADLARINRITTMGELTASLAHEINQPIAAAVTDANTSLRWLASATPNIEEAREAAKRAAKDATRAAEIITRIRSLFKKETPQRESVDLNAVIEEMISLLRSEATRYGVSIESNLAADLPQVMADRVQVQQVLMNLMLNSIDAMKGVDNPRKLTLTSQRDGGAQLLVAVSDTGVGLPPQMEQVFHAFFTTKPHGTGMGLAISRTIIESHGGRLWAASNSGRGAVFHFTLPTTIEAQ